MKKLLPFVLAFILSILLIFRFSYQTFAQDCEIGEVQATPLDCNESGFFMVEINFDYANVGSEGFHVQGNGYNYGNFEYGDLPVQVGPLEGDGETVYEFAVIDNQVEGCSNWTEIDPVDCEGGECYISELTIDDYPCEEGYYNVLLNFDYQNVGDNGFKLYVNYDLFGEYNYEELPLNIGPFTGDGESVYHFLVQDATVDNCASDANFGPIQCDTTGECHIWDVNAAVLPCNESGNFNVQLDFNFINTGNEGFHVQGNGHNYGNFEYADLPIQIGPLEGDGTTEYEFVVIDNQHDDCSDWTSIDPVDCDGGNECNIHDMTVEVNPCEEGHFNVDLNFEYEHVSEAGFNLFVNYDLYGTYNYADLPINIGPLAGDGETAYHFLVRDVYFDDCAEDISIDPVDCNEGECHIWDVETTILPCNEEGEFNVLLNFEYEHVGDEGFEVHGNGNNYGSFEYADLPVELGPFVADGESEYEFGVNDKQFDNCHSGTAIDPFICDSALQIINMSMEVQDCEDDTYYLIVDFDMLEPGNESFTVAGNGMEPQTFYYSELPVTIGPLTNDKISSYYFIVQNEDGFGDWRRLFPFTCESLGFIERTDLKNQLNIFPNPSSGLVYFKNIANETVEIFIYDLTGNEVNKINLESNSIQSFKFEETGLYFYRASNGQSLVSGKFTIN